MTCTPFKIGDQTGLVCARGKPRRKDLCSKCGRRLSTLLCDFPVGEKTCDKPLCEGCAIHTGPDRDQCPHHPHHPDPDAALFADLPAVTK